ncbi:hypothetical protein BD770DRAFT_31715 [Pilaira anomala]|nr:hypothetical protein BD770DRAFT_31715 [Pilaira anomala]
MNPDSEMTNSENTPISFISQKMETLQVPDNTLVCQYFKDGKLYFNEPKLRAESHDIIAEKLLAYRKYRASVEKEDNITYNTVEIPPIYLDLIAALVQDSEEPLTVLSSRLDDLLSPFLRNEFVANKFEYAIQKAVKKIAYKANYGLTEEVYATIEHTAPKIPWHLHISRWEVRNIQVLPPDLQQIIGLRRENRQQMTNVFTGFIQNLSSTERSVIVNTKHRRSPVSHKELEDIRIKQVVELEQRKKEEEEKKAQNEAKRLLEEEKKRQREEEKRVRDEEKRVRDEEKRKREDEKKKKAQVKKKKKE